MANSYPFDNVERENEKEKFSCYGLRKVANSTIMSWINKFSGRQEWRQGKSGKKEREISARPPKYKYFQVRTF